MVPVCAGALVSGSCAKQAPPPGGPEDRTPPALAASVPPSGSTGVPREAPVRLEFSEKIETRSFERGLKVTPRVRWRDTAWSGPAVVLTPADSLLPDTTYVLSLGAAVKDRRNNFLPVPLAVAFSTGPEIDRSVLVGRVSRSGKPVPGASVLLYPWVGGRDMDPEVDDPYRQIDTDVQGSYALPFLRPAARAYEVMAFLDANQTGAFEEGDPWGVFPEPVTVAAFPETTGGMDLELWDSARTGSLSGTVVGEWDPEAPVILEMTARGDSAVTRTQRISRPGPFRWAGIEPGTYAFGAFQDLNGSGTWDDTETLREPRARAVDSLGVTAGAPVGGLEVRPGAGTAP